MEQTEKILAAAECIRRQVQLRPRIGLVLGSGLGDYADTVHEMARDEARHGAHLKGMLERYFK